MKKIVLMLGALASLVAHAQVRLVVESISNDTDYPLQVLNSQLKEITVILPGKSYNAELIYELNVRYAELNFYQMQPSGSKERFLQFVGSFNIDMISRQGALSLLLQKIPLLEAGEKYFEISNDYNVAALRSELESWVFRVKIELNQKPQDSIIFFNREVVYRR